MRGRSLGELVSLHPFADGNGRTARLLMNLVLIRGSYPPVAIWPDDRAGYLEALRQADRGDKTRFDALLYRRLEATWRSM